MVGSREKSTWTLGHVARCPPEYNLLGLANYFDGIGLAIQNNKNSLKFNHTQKKCYKCKTGQCLG
jgi:hypothetical protein